MRCIVTWRLVHITIDSIRSGAGLPRKGYKAGSEREDENCTKVDEELQTNERKGGGSGRLKSDIIMLYMHVHLYII